MLMLALNSVWEEMPGVGESRILVLFLMSLYRMKVWPISLSSRKG